MLRKAGVNFAVLGREEKGCGDPTRRIGNEFLFESLARENVLTQSVMILLSEGLVEIRRVAQDGMSSAPSL